MRRIETDPFCTFSGLLGMVGAPPKPHAEAPHQSTITQVLVPRRRFVITAILQRAIRSPQRTSSDCDILLIDQHHLTIPSSSN